jgi:hypothetical protein
MSLNIPQAGRSCPFPQPYDSRTAAALRQHALAKARAGRAAQGQSLPRQAVDLLNRAFIEDPDGVEAIAGLQQAVDARLRAATAHEAWQREEYARARAEEQERKEKERRQRTEEEASVSRRRLLGLDRTYEPRSERGAAPKNEDAEPIGQHVDFDGDGYPYATSRAARVDPVRQLLARKKPAAPVKEAPPAKSWGQWLGERFGTPVKPTWR